MKLDDEYKDEFKRLCELMKRRCAKRETDDGVVYFMTILQMPNVMYIHPYNFLEELLEQGMTVDLPTMRIVDVDGVIDDPRPPEPPEAPSEDIPEEIEKAAEEMAESVDVLVDEDDEQPEQGDMPGHPPRSLTQEIPSDDDLNSTTNTKDTYQLDDEQPEDESIDSIPSTCVVTGCDICMKNYPVDEVSNIDDKATCNTCATKEPNIDDIPDVPDEIAERDELPENQDDVLFYTLDELKVMSYKELKAIAGRDPDVSGNLNTELLIEKLTNRPKFFPNNE